MPSQGPHRPNITLSPAQEAVVVELRRTTLLAPDDLLRVTREFIHPDVSRAGLDRCRDCEQAPSRRGQPADLRPQEEAASTTVKTF